MFEIQMKTKTKVKPRHLVLLYQVGYDEMDRKDLAMGFCRYGQDYVL